MTVLDQENRASRGSRSEADRPGWALRMREARHARGWTQPQMAEQMRASADTALVANESLVRSLKRWEAGDGCPSRFYQQVLSRTLGESCDLLFPSQGSGLAEPGLAEAPSLAAAERALAAHERAASAAERAEVLLERAELATARAQLAQLAQTITEATRRLGQTDTATTTAATASGPAASQPAIEPAIPARRIPESIACEEEPARITVTEVVDLDDESCVDDAPAVGDLDDYYDEDGWD